MTGLAEKPFLFFYKYKDMYDHWHWQLKAHGEIIARSYPKEGYSDEAGCDRAIELIKAAPDAPIQRNPNRLLPV